MAFIVTGVLVNAGLNTEHRTIGFDNWNIPGAPFVGGFGGFARVFVTASFACKYILRIKFIFSFHLLYYRWWNRISRDHCRRDKKSN